MSSPLSQTPAEPSVFLITQKIAATLSAKPPIRLEATPPKAHASCGPHPPCLELCLGDFQTCVALRGLVKDPEVSVVAAMREGRGGAERSPEQLRALGASQAVLLNFPTIRTREIIIAGKKLPTVPPQEKW